MTIQRERLNRKNAGGSYDTIHLETQADLVLMASDPSRNVEQVLGETVTIARGGTGATTTAAGLYALANELPPMTSDDLAEDDYICFVDVASSTAKKVSLKELLNLSGGGSEPEEPVTNPNWPDKSQLTLGNTITWADQQWIVSHVTSYEAYLTLKSMSGESTWYNLQSACTNFANKFTEAQKECLKSIRAGNTSGIVFVATKDQMAGEYGGFSYFNSNSRRNLGSYYWTSTDAGAHVDAAWVVTSYGGFDENDDRGYSYKSHSHGFRPSVCIDLVLYG